VSLKNNGVYLPVNAEIITRTQESSDIFTLGLRLSALETNKPFGFLPGQFNMLY
jgi:NAD(P)H-flavin reductase